MLWLGRSRNYLILVLDSSADLPIAPHDSRKAADAGRLAPTNPFEPCHKRSMSEPIEHRFYHEVVSPLIRLQVRCAENVCVQEHFNDVIVLAQEAATAAYHCPEAIFGHQRQMTLSSSEDLRRKLSDVVDSRKHGVLRNADRQTSLQAALAYEFNDAQEFRYWARGSLPRT